MVVTGYKWETAEQWKADNETCKEMYGIPSTPSSVTTEMFVASEEIDGNGNVLFYYLASNGNANTDELMVSALGEMQSFEITT